MIADIGVFRTTVEITSLDRHNKRRELRDVMVDTGSLYSWIPRVVLDALGIKPVRTERFESRDGRILTRDVGYAIVFAAGRSTPTIVAFADEGDLVLIGSMTLDGMNLRIDRARRELVPAGPVPVAAAA